MEADLKATNIFPLQHAFNNWTFVPVIPAEPFYFYRFYEQREYRTEKGSERYY